MRKPRKSDKPELLKQKDSIVINDDGAGDEAATERFINRLELQRKLLINFIDPPAGKPCTETVEWESQNLLDHTGNEN